MTPLLKRRIGGVVMIALGLALIWFVEGMAVHSGRVPTKGALGPAAVVLGLAMELMPGYREERLARGEDISALSGPQLITRRWWVVLALALAAGGAYLVFVIHGGLLLRR